MIPKGFGQSGGAAVCRERLSEGLREGRWEVAMDIDVCRSSNLTCRQNYELSTGDFMIPTLQDPGPGFNAGS